MKHELTEWYPGHVKPVRDGVYQTPNNSSNGQNVFQYWDGHFWGFRCLSPDIALKYRFYKSAHQNPKWRGIKK